SVPAFPTASGIDRSRTRLPGLLNPVAPGSTPPCPASRKTVALAGVWVAGNAMHAPGANETPCAVSCVGGGPGGNAERETEGLVRGVVLGFGESDSAAISIANDMPSNKRNAAR